MEEAWLAGVGEGAPKERLVPATPRILVVHGLAAVRVLPEQHLICLVFSAALGPSEEEVVTYEVSTVSAKYRDFIYLFLFTYFLDTSPIPYAVSTYPIVSRYRYGNSVKYRLTFGDDGKTGACLPAHPVFFGSLLPRVGTYQHGLRLPFPKASANNQDSPLVCPPKPRHTTHRNRSS